ncbi:hypothetical protein MRB53_040708 [Persea americana]|nr:hypothetical protein MRB53_040708 [Persea americana]
MLEEACCNLYVRILRLPVQRLPANHSVQEGEPEHVFFRLCTFCDRFILTGISDSKDKSMETVLIVRAQLEKLPLIKMTSSRRVLQADSSEAFGLPTTGGRFRCLVSTVLASKRWARTQTRSDFVSTRCIIALRYASGFGGPRNSITKSCWRRSDIIIFVYQLPRHKCVTSVIDSTKGVRFESKLFYSLLNELLILPSPCTLPSQHNTSMSASNPAPGVGGTAKDGGLSTADTVRDGGPTGNTNAHGKEQYLPEGAEAQEKAYTGGAKESNPAPNVGGTAKDGGLSTAATVADGGPDDMPEDGDYKPPS